MSSGAPVEHGTPIRMPAVALLCVDSIDAVRYDASGYINNDSTPASIQINKQSPLLFGYMTRIALTEINFAWATPNVNSRNNTLTIRISDVSGAATGAHIKGDYRIALTESFYTPNQLKAAVEAALDYLSVSGEAITWTVQFSEREQYFTITCGLGTVSNTEYYFSILPPGETYTITDTATNNSPTANVFTGIVEDDLTYMMGLAPPAATKALFFDEIRGGFASCQYTPYVDIVSSILTKNQNVRDNDTTLRNGQAKLARVYLSNPGANNQFTIDEDSVVYGCNIVGVRPFVLHREFQTPKVISWNTTENVDIIDLQVVDRLGYPIYIEQRVVSSNNATLILVNTAAFHFTIQSTEV